MAAELESLAVDLVTGAATLIRERGSTDLAVSSKSTATDLVTQVDRDIEAWLVEHLRAARAHDAILGEEGGPSGSGSVRWLIDPIDGTVNYILGIPQFAVSLAAELDGTVVAGAVVNPTSGDLFRAHLGGGAWLAERRLHARRDVPLERAVIGTGFGYDAALRARQGAIVAALLPQVSDIRRIGSASLDLCSTAAGRLDGYFEAGLSPWDYAAGALIAAEAGCLVTGLHGRAASPRFLAAAGTSLAADFFALLESLGADAVTA
ncbi:MAG: inositol monophosphatase [Actinomycetota bacterium]|nr:inositol monophosphatase [Actinomycetota bacterium]